MKQEVIMQWLWRLEDAKTVLEEIIAEGYRIVQFQVVQEPVFSINDDPHAYVLVVVERDIRARYAQKDLSFPEVTFPVSE